MDPEVNGAFTQQLDSEERNETKERGSSTLRLDLSRGGNQLSRYHPIRVAH